jgi:hypothetical protein
MASVSNRQAQIAKEFAKAGVQAPGQGYSRLFSMIAKLSLTAFE